MSGFVDQLTIHAKAGNGGDGVVRWRRVKFVPMGGPAGGNGGNGGDVYLRAVRDVSLLSKYTGSNEFVVENGEGGKGDSQHGRNSDDLYIDIPVGSVVTDELHERSLEFFEEGQVEKILRGGKGGLGNEYFKSSTNRSPEQSTEGKVGEVGTFRIELSLVVDVGLVGVPNAGKSTLINALTNSRSAIGAYPFTTTVPHLGALYEFTIADIPGLIEGASDGKGLGHTFLRHVSRTKMILHLIALDQFEPEETYKTIRNELSTFDTTLAEKDEWIILTKKDLANKGDIDVIKNAFDKIKKNVFVIAENDAESIKTLSDALVAHLRKG